MGAPSHYFSSSVQVNGAVWALKAQILCSSPQRHSPAHTGVLSILPGKLCLHPGPESSHGLPAHLPFLSGWFTTAPSNVCLLGHPEPAQKGALSSHSCCKMPKAPVPALQRPTALQPLPIHFPRDKSHKVTSSTGRIISQDN